MLYEISISTSKREEMIDITEIINEKIKSSKITEGLCIIFVPHTTAGITVNEGADPDVASDIKHTMNKLIPPDGNYAHMEGNSDAHVKSSLTGICQTIIIQNNRLLLGRWQAVWFCEYDGPRKRKVMLYALSVK